MSNDQTVQNAALRYAEALQHHTECTERTIAALDRAIMAMVEEQERQAGRYRISNTSDRED
jgi:hypothetical protein